MSRKVHRNLEDKTERRIISKVELYLTLLSIFEIRVNKEILSLGAEE